MSVRKASSTVLPTFVRYYATQRKVQSSMGIFEPFIDHKLEKQQEQVMASTLISKLTVEDLLPDKDILELIIKHKKTILSIEKQQQLTKLFLEHIQKGTDAKDQLLKLVDNKSSEAFTAFHFVTCYYLKVPENCIRFKGIKSLFRYETIAFYLVWYGFIHIGQKYL
ncbi:hypothetical protein K501DRAFT_307293 [Backusella circina FSU 941]|nr:hypothetical protein K501DRAFT_307293 [Backusella circina FSU 941]